MTIEELQKRFCPKETAKMQAFLQEPKSQQIVQLNGLVGSSYPLFVSNLAENMTGVHLFALNSRERAAYFYNDLEKLLNDRNVPLPNKRVHYLPSSFKRAHNTDEIDNSNVKLRSEIVNKIPMRWPRRWSLLNF